MAEINQQAILDRLRSIRDPARGADIVSLGIVSDIVIDGGKVSFSIGTDPDRAAEMEAVRAEAEAAAKDVAGVETATVVLTAEAKKPSAAPPPPQPRPRSRQPVAGAKPAVPGIGAIIAVASGKGGVGKSTTAVNLALGLKALGKTVGVLDADIYGPSLPRLLGVHEKPEQLEGRVLKPLEAHGLKLMSMGFLVEEGTPVIWRGPMVISALTQMLREVAWGELDVLVVDMPPGTGDAQLTMAQQVPLAGAVIVSTPQDLALIDARKGLAMFQRVDVPVLGIVENMSTFVCPHCGQRTDLFGHGGARQEAERLGVPFLGEIPLHIAIRETSDQGLPIIAADPDGAPAAAYRSVAEAVLKELAAVQTKAERPPPRIVIEE
jgi:ATP-binding protein involved in chromosome partitioning